MAAAETAKKVSLATAAAVATVALPAPVAAAVTVWAVATSFGAVDPLAVRLARSAGGNLTEGGVEDPREAVAFIVGYTKLRFMPGMLADKALTRAQQSKLAKRLAPWETVAKLKSKEATVEAAAKIGADNATMKMAQASMSGVFGTILAASSTNRRSSIEILMRAAAWFSASGFPALGETMVLAADTSAEPTGFFAAVVRFAEEAPRAALEEVKDLGAAGIRVGEEVITATGEVIKEAGEPLVEAAGHAVDKAEQMVDGGLNVLNEAAKAGKKKLEDGLAEAKADLVALKDAGADELNQRYEQLQQLATEAKAAVGEKKDELLDRLRVAAASFEAQLASLKSRGTAMQQALAESLTGALDKVKAAGLEAREIVGKRIALLETAVAEQVGDAKKMLTQANAVLVSVKNDPCQFVGSGPAAFMCRTATGTGGVAGSTLAWVLIGVPVALLLLFLAVRSAGAAKAIAGLKALATA